jgi:hypothetical protein
MSWKKLLGLAASGVLVSVAAVAGNGCSSSNSSTGGAQDAASEGIIHHEAGSSSGVSSSGGTDSGDDGSSSGSFDGTTGKACTTDADCHSPTGPGTNKCTSDGFFGSAGGNTLYPTSVCLNLANCNPGDGTTVVFCDGDPTNPSSPGVCLSTGSAGKGICLPQCNFKQDGSAVTGCTGKDACFGTGFFNTDASGANIGIGYCFGGCDTDADCSVTGQHCQADEGLCVKSVVTPDAGELAIGTGCNSNGTTAPSCNCIAPSSGLGYCAQFCVTGRNECATGQVCEAQLPTQLIDTATDATIAGWTKQNPGMGGWCAPTCTGEGGTCTYPNSTCQTGTVAGPDCEP